MAKSEDTLIGWFILICIICAPFVWLHERIGWLGIFILAAIVIGFGIFWHISNIKKIQITSDDRTNKKQKTFDDLALYVLHNRLNPDEARKINLELTRSDFPRSALIRNLQIIRDSIEIALTSKKKDTAESRMKILLERYEEIRMTQNQLVSEEVFDEINRVIQETKDDFHTKLYINIAMGYIDKAKQLKTIKSKVKYLNLAKDALNEGLEKGFGIEADLHRVLLQVNQTEANLE